MSSKATLTPEERRARKSAGQARYRTQHRARLAAAESERRAKMTPQDKRAAQSLTNAWKRQNYHANLEQSRIQGSTHQRARRAAMTPEERQADLLYQRQKNAQYRARHRARIRAKYIQKRLENGEGMREAERQRRKDHPGQYSARNGEWNKAHPEKVQAASQKWRRKDNNGPTACKRRRALRAGAPRNDLTHAQWLAIQAAQNHCCAYCGKRCKGHLTQDHILPLIKGGSHTLHNVIGACRSCNSKKHTGPPLKAVQPLLL